MKYISYYIAYPFIKLFILLYKPTIIGKENIPTKGILVGNHKSTLDPLLLISSTNKHINFFAKKELFKPIIKYLFINAGVISVDRKTKNKESISKGINKLNNNELICIFPEGTISKDDNLLPFKYGAVSIASKTSSLICPFIIKGKYKLFKKNIKLIYLEPYYISDDLEYENNKLKNIIEKELKSE